MSEYLRLVLAESFQWCTSGRPPNFVSIGTWTRIPYPVKYPCTHTGETHLFALLQPADKVTSMTSTIPTGGYPTEHSGVLPKFGVPFLSPSRGCEPHVQCIKGPRRRLSLEVLRRHPTDHCGCTSRFELDEPRPMMLTTPLAAHETRPPRHPTPLILLAVARVRVEVKEPSYRGRHEPVRPDAPMRSQVLVSIETRPSQRVCALDAPDPPSRRRGSRQNTSSTSLRAANTASRLVPAHRSSAIVPEQQEMDREQGRPRHEVAAADVVATTHDHPK